MLALFRTLSPQQLTPVQQAMLQQLGDATPAPVRVPVQQINFHKVLMPSELTAFYRTSHGLPTAIEVRALTTLLLIHFDKPGEDGLSVESWQRDVDTDAERTGADGQQVASEGRWHLASPEAHHARTRGLVAGGCRVERRHWRDRDGGRHARRRGFGSIWYMIVQNSKELARLPQAGRGRRADGPKGGLDGPCKPRRRASSVARWAGSATSAPEAQRQCLSRRRAERLRHER